MQLLSYRRVGHHMGCPVAIRQRSKLHPSKRVLDQQLVYIKYNQSLKEHFDCKNVRDSIVLTEADESNEWLLGEMTNKDEEAAQEDELEFDDLTWGHVEAATGVGEPIGDEIGSEEEEDQIYNGASDEDKEAILDLAAEDDDI